MKKEAMKKPKSAKKKLRPKVERLEERIAPKTLFINSEAASGSSGNPTHQIVCRPPRFKPS